MKKKSNQIDDQGSVNETPEKKGRYRITREEFIRRSLANPKNVQTVEERIERLRQNALQFTSIEAWRTAYPYAVKTATEIGCLDVCTKHMIAE